MYKCSKCGKEYEGNFCPYCGEKRSKENFCSNCGAEIDGDLQFCPNCGNSLVSQKVDGGKNRSNTGNFKEKIFSLLKWVPVLSFSLFSLLLFAFFAAPIAVVPVLRESYGSAYTLAAEIPDLKGETVALIIFAVLSIISLAAVWAVRYVHCFGYRRINVFGKKMNLSQSLEYVSFVFYLIFFLLGCIICGKIATLDGGIGLMSAGACPVLVLVFSIIFALFATGALVARYFLKKYYPEYANRENEKENAEFEDYRVKIEKLARSDAPVEPQKVEKPKAPLKAAKLKKKKVQAELFGLVFVAVATIVFTFALIIFDSIIDYEEYDGKRTSWYLNVYLLSGAAALMVIAALLTLCIRIKNVNAKKIYKQGFLIFSTLISIGAIFPYSIMLIVEPLAEFSGNISYNLEMEILCSFIASGVIALFGLVAFFWNLAVIIRIKKIKKNEEKFREMNEQLNEYETMKDEYLSYLKQYDAYSKQYKKHRRSVKVYDKIMRNR